MDYVPLIYAAAIIAKDPARYGFGDVVYEPQVEWDTVSINKCLDLRAVADATRAAIRSVSNHKPVWTILPQYESKIPTREELRIIHEVLDPDGIFIPPVKKG